jgi:hypothetical protein
MRKICSPQAIFAVLSLQFCVSTGCQLPPQTIEMDVGAHPVRFLIHHQGWPAPLMWPRIDDFAIATQEEVIWQLKATSGRGVPARDLAIAFGKPPDDFAQVLPEQNKSPRPLVRGKTYFVAAGSKQCLYRIVFSLPVDAHLPLPTTTQPEP